MLIATKWEHTAGLRDGQRGGDPVQVRRRLHASLARLGTDHVDHYQLHRPDPATPAAETLGCLQELRAEGKIREIGCTHFTAAELAAAHEAALATGVPPYASVQNHYSLLTRDPETDGVVWRLDLGRGDESLYRATALSGCEIFANTSLCPGAP